MRDSAVVGRTRGGEERVHAVLLLAAGTDPQAVRRAANAALLDHQKIQSVSVWPGEDLPRTEGTRKLRRREIRKWVEGETSDQAAEAARHEDRVEDVAARFARGGTVTGATTLDELGLSSLERVELLMALEERFNATIDETSSILPPLLFMLLGSRAGFPTRKRPEAIARLRKITTP